MTPGLGETPSVLDSDTKLVFRMKRKNPNEGIEGATWDTYRKTVATWAVKLPVDVTIPTREGEVEGEAGDYLCIDSDGGLYPCDGDTFETMYERTEVSDDE